MKAMFCKNMRSMSSGIPSLQNGKECQKEGFFPLIIKIELNDT